ncbi:MAG: TonB-dependent receptor [Bryobacterales bacterium]|nr:TonB-dependent receptor [Bryobacterales bacterium]
MHRLASLCSTLLLSFAAFLHADVTGTITGSVLDPTGALIPAAEVAATNTGTNAVFRGVTDANGVYIFRAIPVGAYNVSVQARGFKKTEHRDIRLQVNEIARIDVTLAIGETAETVTVEANVVTVDTTTATLKTVVDKKRIEELPLNGRNPTQLMRLVAGVQADFRADVTSGTTYPGITPVSVNGGRANQTNYVLDGAQNNDHYSNAPNPMPNPDALQEFSVQTNNFSAEFGRNSGGVVNAVTRSGTNEFHGAAFEYIRNKALNAANFFNPIVNGVRRDDGLKRNQYGFTLGGPVLLPKLYNGRDKTFFFFSYQKTTLRQAPAAASRIVPTAAQKRGDFSALTRALRDPFANAPYAGNLIPQSQFNPIARTIADNYLPLPDSGNTVSFQVPTSFDDDQILVRGDQQIGSRHRLSGRYWKSWALQPSFLDPRNYLATVGGRKWNNWSTTVTDTWTVSPTLLNTVLFSKNYTDGPVVQVGPEKSLSALGVKMFNDDKPQYHMTINGYFQINTGDTNNFFRDEYQISDTLRWTKGRHNLSFGGEYGYGKGDIVNNFRANGQFQWNGSAPFTSDALADYYVGKFSQLVQGIGEYKTTRFDILAFFVQDSFKVNRRLTLDLGMRWDPFFPYTDTLGRLSSWRPGAQSTRYVNAPRGVLYPGDPGLPDGGYNTAWGNFGPRLGFAWDVNGNGRTSVRGGYGVFYDRSNTISTNSAANQGPFGTVLTLFGNNANNFTDPYAGATNPFPASQDPPRDVRFVLPHTAFVYEEHMTNARLQSWNLTVERQVAGGFVTRAAYAGSRGSRLIALREANAATYAVGATTATTNQRRPLAPDFANVTLLEPVGNSFFHSLQLTAEKRFSKGFSVLANYMWSKSLDDGSANKSTGQTRTNPFNQRFDRGLSDFDHAQVFTFSGLWQLPIKFENKAANVLLGGWNLTSIVNLQSGFPFTVASGVDNARTGTGGQRADLIGNPLLSGSRTRGERIFQWLNPAAFALNTVGTYGALGRNTFRGPGLATTDFGLHKAFPITERVKTEFRFEVFNALNRVNLQGPDTNRSSGNFMRTTAAFDPRILQMALRVAW